MATALGIATLSLAAEEPAAAVIPLAIGAAYLGGAISGNRTVNKCREAIADYEGGYREDQYADNDDDDGALRNRPRPGRPSDPYGEVPAYPRPAQNTYAEQPAYPPQRPLPPQPPAQPPAQQPPVQQPPVQQQPAPQQLPPQPPAKQPRPAESDGDWSDFWREVP